ncbi:ABC transporter substrate-binding protein [uncultured Phenylobacterium sp.]|uniref:ABC transporter substrate-binding protein n=1 Tax=uncultured Phenylobacterium sp. TaxID=349273 RepID=UPI0025F0D3E1|nr:ABC transporter substrate-binding protein [uncultured Phenylobacterium sp.]
MSGERLRLGFIALNDAAALIVADALGYFGQEGLAVDLVREVSWATMRDKLAVGALDGAHLLAPLALAASLGAPDGRPIPLVAPLALNINGPAITLSSHLAAAVGEGPHADGLARLIARRREEGASPLTLAVVFPLSVHAYLLRDWLARAGVDPDNDVRLTVAPPSRMTELLVGGVVEGFCVTEPWDTAAVVAGAGMIAARGSELWPRTPDKVFAVTEAWAEADPPRLRAVLRALLRAAAWADAQENRAELAAILARPHYVGADAAVIEASLGDIVFDADGASAPQPVHAAWLLSQMMRWRHIPADVDIGRVAGQVYRPDLHAAAAVDLGRPAIVPLDGLVGFSPLGPFRLAEAQAHAVHGALSRLRPA